MLVSKEKNSSTLRDARLSFEQTLSAIGQTVAALCADNDEYSRRLDEVERHIEETSAFPDGRALRFRLSECVQGLRNAGMRQRDEMNAALTQLRDRLNQLETTKEGPAPVVVDAITGLPNRESAEQALTAALERRKPAYAVAFAVSRVHLINARFGYSTGNQILLRARDHLAARLGLERRLFRWTGPVFVALIEQEEEPDAEVQRITSAKLETGVSIGDSSVMLPIHLVSLLCPLAQVTVLAELTQRIDAFVGEQARH